MPTGPTVDDACVPCFCDKCLQTIDVCRSMEGCWDIIECGIEKGCSLEACLSEDKCLHVIIGVPGGVAGTAVALASSLNRCALEECPEACPIAGR
jgi:hypothetical protein